MYKVILAAFIFASTLRAMPTFVGYSGAPGSLGTCASSCHGSGTGSIVVTGIPSSYQPLKTYSITVKHTNGSFIYNFNASTRRGSTTAAGGSFVAGLNASLYTVSGSESGVHSGTIAIDSATFQWVAPAKGTGTVSIYVSGIQGSMSGPNTKVVVVSTESTTEVVDNSEPQAHFELGQNFPNPFNPSTTIRYMLPSNSTVKLTVIDLLGKVVDELVNEDQAAGWKEVLWNNRVSSGIYLYRIEAIAKDDSKQRILQTKKMLVVK